jgi:predicted phage terminase large subunit-like protein
MLTQNHDTSNTLHPFTHKFCWQSLKCFILRSFYTLNSGAYFIDNWHIDLIIRYLHAVEQKQIRRLIINLPPRSLKSTIISAAWPAWLLARHPDSRIIVASYSQGLSQKLSLDSRLIMQSNWYKKAFPKSIIRLGSNTKNKFYTTANGFRFATSVGGTLTGEGANFLIMDDPVTPIQAASHKHRRKVIQWFEQTFASRLDDRKNGSITLVMQRLHEEDLAGYLIKKGGWQVLSLPALTDQDFLYKIGDFAYLRRASEPLDPQRASSDEIQVIKNEIGSYGYNAQYLQQPLLQHGNIIKHSWLRKVEQLPINFDAIYHSWDCAVKTGMNNDFSVCTIWGVIANQYYLIDMLREKLEFPSLKHEVVNLAQKYQPAAVLIEDKASGQALLQELRHYSALPIIAILPKKEKFVRLLSTSHIIESGRVHVPLYAAWLQAFELELTTFPNASHDDVVDSTSQFLEWINNMNINNLKVRTL